MSSLRNYRAVLATVLLMLLAIPVLAAETAPAAPAGHWEGEIQIPGTELGIDVDLSQDGGSPWRTTRATSPAHASYSRMACTR
jgi:hypothetical protein